MPGTIPVLNCLASSDTHGDETALKAFLEEIAMNMVTAIQSQVDQGLLDVDVRCSHDDDDALVDGVVIGG